MGIYDVKEYTEDNLAIEFSFKISKSKVKEKYHYGYLCEYLNESEGIGAKTIVIEKRYVSKAYFSDYSNYYSTCFQDYDRFCKRLHFFNKKFDKDFFVKELLNNKSDFLNRSYLGYVVVKPLPDSIIGPTLLKTYDSRLEKKRFYNSIRKYNVNLFGLELKLESLAFQEQDTVVSACASTAIWSAFHMTSKLFQTPLPSPSEITKSGGNLYFNTGRTFPNQGLDLNQICKAIEQVGLVSELRNSSLYTSEMTRSKRFIYAYNKAGIPVLLFIKLKDREHHLVTINGYSEETKELEKSENISLKADRIERFYAHDDQIGPFARLGFINETALETSWRDMNGENILARIHAIIVPIHPKVRISYDDVFKKINLIDRIFFKFFNPELEWDIFLQESNKYKNSVLQNSNVSNRIKQKICLSNLPKYLWIASAYVEGELIFDFVFDSTDISRGHFCIDFSLHDKLAAKQLEAIVTAFKSDFVDRGVKMGSKMYGKLIKELTAAYQD